MIGKRIDRRFFLKGAAGVSLALPMLNIMADDKSNKKSNTPPKRMVCIFFPNGIGKEKPGDPWNWYPLTNDKTNYKFSKPMESLEDLRNETTIMHGLSHPNSRNIHGHSTAGLFLTGTFQGFRKQIPNTVSVDQVYADMVGDQTRMKSMVLSSDGGIGAPTSSQTMSFDNRGKPIFAESSPKRLFNRLFGMSGKAELNALKDEKSLLDSTLEHGRMLHKKLGVADKERFERYLDSVREVERRLKKAEEWITVPKPKNSLEVDVEIQATSPAEYIKTMFDLMFMALETDSTRTVTYQFGQEGSAGVGDTFGRIVGSKITHSLSHTAQKTNDVTQIGQFMQFMVNEFATLMKRLKESKDTVDPMLDNTLCLFGSATGRVHTSRNYPLIFGGGKNLGFKHGQYLRFKEENSRLSNLYLTMLQQLGVETEKFCDSTGICSEFLS